MLALGLSILSSSLLMVIFKYFTRFEVNNTQAITVNYLIACTMGMLLSDGPLPGAAVLGKSWATWAAVMGVSFFIIFNIIALSSQRVGVAISSVANKMSMVIPVGVGIAMLGEEASGINLLGIALALAAVTLTIWPGKGLSVEWKHVWLPAVIFFASGMLDSGLKLLETFHLTESEFPVFSATVFAVAASAGIALTAFRRIQGEILEWRSVAAGIVLGIPNYFSIHFLLMALSLPGLDSTVVFPINNTGIVLLSTLLALALFKERIGRVNAIGIALSVVSIFLISYRTE